MPNYSSKNLAKNSMLLLIYRCASMVISLLYVPVVLGYLGIGLYGIWATILSVLSWINYFDIGIGNGLRNRLSASLARNDSESVVKGLISSAYFLLAVVMLLVALLAIVLFQFIDWNSLLNVSVDLYPDVRPIIEISFLLMCVSFFLSIVSSMYYATQQAHVVSLIGVAQQVIMLASVFLLTLTRGDKLGGVAWAYGLSAIVVQLVFTFIFFARNRACIPGIRYIRKDYALNVTGLGLQFFVVQIASLVLFSTDNVVVSNLFGPDAVTSYTTANKLFTILTSLFAAFVSPYWSSITAASAVGDVKSIRKSISKMRLYALVPLAAAVVLYLVLDQLILIWLGQPLDMPLGLKEMLLAYTLVYTVNTVYSQAANGLALMKMMMRLAVVQAIVNIPLSLFFGHLIGRSTGVLLGTVLTMMTSLLVYPMTVNKALSTLKADCFSVGNESVDKEGC